VPKFVNKSRVALLFGRLRDRNPQPTTELRYQTPFQLLVAVMLSAQATDRSVNQATSGLFRAADNPKAMLELGEEGVKHHIRTIGLFNNKASNLIKTCQILVDRHDGKVPEERSELEALPGVGRKTANVILNTAFGHPTIAVDTHIFRVSNRTGLARGKTPLAVEQRLLEVTPTEFRQHAHHWLILLGRYTCLARKPRCLDCPVADICTFPGKSVVDEAPGTPPARGKRR